jgi:DNA replication protein DnaC
MRVPPRYRRKNLDSLTGYEPEKEQTRLALSFDGSVFLSGGPGAGKTHMAIGLMWEWLKNKLRIDRRQDGGEIIWGVNYKAGDTAHIPVFLPASDMYAEIKDTFDGKGPESERMLTTRYASAAFLVLDDVGAEQITDWKRAVLYSLIDRRYREMRQTVITSNLSLDDIAAAIDERIASRIVEMGAVITLAGSDYRLRRAQ